MPTNTAPTVSAYGPIEERINTVSHAIGVFLSIIGTLVLVAKASVLGDPWRIVSMAIYGASLVALFLSSTLYHAATDPAVKWRLKTWDHCAIFFLIAGTYTPFLLVNLRASVGWWLFAIIWGLAAFGIGKQLIFGQRFKPLEVGTYLLMGWLVVFASSSLNEHLNSIGLWLLVAGGVVYTIGVLFYLIKRIPYNHAIWHLFVMAGAGCHFFAVYYGAM